MAHNNFTILGSINVHLAPVSQKESLEFSTSVQIFIQKNKNVDKLKYILYDCYKKPPWFVPFFRLSIRFTDTCAFLWGRRGSDRAAGGRLTWSTGSGPWRPTAAGHRRRSTQRWPCSPLGGSTWTDCGFPPRVSPETGGGEGERGD